MNQKDEKKKKNQFLYDYRKLAVNKNNKKSYNKKSWFTEHILSIFK